MAVSRAPSRRVISELEKETPVVPTLEDALDDMLGERFTVPCDEPNLAIAGNWNSEAEIDMGIQMGLIEAVLTDPSGMPEVHVRGYSMTADERHYPFLDNDTVLDAADTINDEYMTAAMAMIERGLIDDASGVLIITSVVATSQAQKPKVLSKVLHAIIKWRPEIHTIGVVISPSNEEVSRISTRAGVDQETTRSVLEDTYRSRFANMEAPETASLDLLSIPYMSHEESMMALGRYQLGEGLGTILAAPTAGNAHDMLNNAAKMPVPTQLLINYRMRIEGEASGKQDLIEKAILIANEYTIQTGAAQPGVFAQSEEAINATATLLSMSLYMRSLAFEQAFENDELSKMLIDLRNQDRAADVFEVAATASYDPGVGDIPKFLPDFRERIEDLVMMK